MALAVVVHRQRHVAGGVLIALGDLGEQVAVDVGLPVIEVTEHVGRTGDADGAIGTAGELIAGKDQVNGAEAQPLVDVGFLAQ